MKSAMSRMMIAVLVAVLAGQARAVAVWSGGNAGDDFGLRGLKLDGTPVFGLTKPAADTVRSIERGPDGNVYVSDAGINKVSKWDAHGNLLDADWIPSTTLSQKQNYGSDWGPNGNFYQLMNLDMEVLVFDASGGTPNSTIDLTAGGTLFPGFTVDLEFDSIGKFYVTDVNNGRIFRYHFQWHP